MAVFHNQLRCYEPITGSKRCTIPLRGLRREGSNRSVRSRRAEPTQQNGRIPCYPTPDTRTILSGGFAGMAVSFAPSEMSPRRCKDTGTGGETT